MENTTLEGKWGDPYVVMLGVLEHADEVLALHRATCVAKADGDAGLVNRRTSQLFSEMADLFVILHRMWDGDMHGFRDEVEERMAKFRP